MYFTSKVIFATKAVPPLPAAAAASAAGPVVPLKDIVSSLAKVTADVQSSPMVIHAHSTIAGWCVRMAPASSSVGWAKRPLS